MSSAAGSARRNSVRSPLASLYDVVFAGEQQQQQHGGAGVGATKDGDDILCVDVVHLVCRWAIYDEQLLPFRTLAAARLLLHHVHQLAARHAVQEAHPLQACLTDFLLSHSRSGNVNCGCEDYNSVARVFWFCFVHSQTF